MTPLPAPVVKQRMRAALAAAERSAAHMRAEALGRVAEVLLEERRDGWWRGYSSQYLRYYVQPRRTGAVATRESSTGAELAPGRLVRVVADQVCKDGVKGWSE
jgi:hypothetical protein